MLVAAHLGLAVSLLQDLHAILPVDLCAEYASTLLLCFRNLLRLHKIIVHFASGRGPLSVKQGSHAAFRSSFGVTKFLAGADLLLSLFSDTVFHDLDMALFGLQSSTGVGVEKRWHFVDSIHSDVVGFPHLRSRLLPLFVTVVLVFVLLDAFRNLR